ncbi:THUMP domain-containing protein 2 [Aplochiton taeniatus]
MEESKCSPHSIRYYCTAGSGMEAFLLSEVKDKLGAENVEQIPGKVFFSSSAAVPKVMELKAAERLFLLLRRDSSLTDIIHKRPAKAASSIQNRLIGDGKEWREAVMSWRRLQRAIMDSDNSTSSLIEGNTTGRGGGLEVQVAPVSFRVSCRCSGALSRRFGPQDLSQTIGTGLIRQLGWKVDLKNPELEVNVHLSDDHTVLGIPLLRSPLARRGYIQTTGLRSTVAWVMSSLADIQPGSCVVDPMCGVGTVLLEAAQEHQEAYFLGVDIDDRQVLRANENVAFAELTDRIHVVQASSLGLPLLSSSVDAVICDVPFGKKFGTKTNMAASLPRIVMEMERVLRVNGTLVLLMSPQLSVLLKKLQSSPGPGPPPLTQGEMPGAGARTSPAPPLSSLKLQSTHRISLGAIDGLIMKYVKIHTD